MSKAAELVNLFHLARTALAYERDQSRTARITWAAQEFHMSNPETSVNRAAKELSRMLDNGAYQPTGL